MLRYFREFLGHLRFYRFILSTKLFNCWFTHHNLSAVVGGDQWAAGVSAADPDPAETTRAQVRTLYDRWERDVAHTIGNHVQIHLAQVLIGGNVSTWK